MKFPLILFFFIFCPGYLTAQEQDSLLNRKKIHISRIQESPKIDGILNDPAWEDAAVATDFIERLPVNGRKIPDSLETRVKIVYDDQGIYFGAQMEDPQPSKIRKELTERDGIGNDDFFFILLNGYNDRQQSMQFIVTAAGVQYDAKMTKQNEDPSWNAVWYSDVRINEDGWVAEIFIPYSELRFPKKKEQVWGLQMEREFRRTGTRYSWSPIDISKGSYSLYDGELYGIHDIDTPVRLSFQPYVSSYINNYDGKTSINYNGGMDLKYGINDAFTLDMILVPDFGQTMFDENVLNLSAFETQYDEQRPFFTEGTELFTKGELFYSRRVGGPPAALPVLEENEEYVNLPSSIGLINALKVSGRTDKGLGIGFFNALTERTYAEVENDVKEEKKEILVEPLTNYNVLVLDQRFNNNSSISFVNTNTTREGHFRDANATGVYADITNSKNTLNYWAGAEGSWVMRDETAFGMEATAGMAKISGKNRFEGGVELRTKDYNINDLGYSSQTNYISYFSHYGYRILKPQGFLNNMFLNFNLNHRRRLEDHLFNLLVFNFNSSFTTKDFFNFGGGFETTPFGKQDIYEPRVDGMFFKVPAYYDQWLWFSTDYRKKFSTEVTVDWYKYDERGRGDLILVFNPLYRISDRISLEIESTANLSDKEEGFVDFNGDEILFGERDRNTIVNFLSANYIFNNKMSLNLLARHYYSDVIYSKFFTLEDNGELNPTAAPQKEYNTTFNSWNLDVRFSWWFAPGSQLSLLYRNAISSYREEAEINFRDNFTNLLNEPQVNNLSLRISYYLNYNKMKNWFGSSKREESAASRNDLFSYGRGKMVK